MHKLSRRSCLKLAAASGAVLALGGKLPKSAFAGTGKLVAGNKDFSPATGKERKMIPSACWMCVTRDAIVGYVEDGRIVKLEGNTNSIRTNGKLCSKGQAGMDTTYFPDRILYPLRRAKGSKRGDGKYVKITWEEALSELSGRLKKLRDGGHPEKFMYHYGRAKGSSDKLAKGTFMKWFGSKTISGHTSICEGAKWTGQELTWGNHYDNWDFANTDYVVNFGSNIFESHTNHIPVSQHLVDAMANGAKLVTFDVRLSNTATRSTEWQPVQPGTDTAVILAMCNVIMSEGLYDKEAFKFIHATEKYGDTTENKVNALKKHLSQFTPQWAEKESGVAAADIARIAREFAKAKAGCVISYRGLVAHYAGANNEMAAQMLAAITGTVNTKGGRLKAVAASWKYPHPHEKAPKAKALKITKGKSNYLPTHGACQEVLPMIKDGSHGRPDVYLWYCYNPVYVNGDCNANAAVLKDESLLPFTVTSNIVYDESSSLADLILPDTPYLERWDFDYHASPTQTQEWYIRQPMIKPLGECRNYQDVLCDLAKRLGFPLGFDTVEEFVKIAHGKTAKYMKEKKIALPPGDFYEYMKKHGAWHDPKQKPKFMDHAKEVKIKGDTVILDEATGVYWDWKKAGAKSAEEAAKNGYAKTKNGYKGYVAQKIGDKAYKGFKPDKLNKSGYLELHSSILTAKTKGAFGPYPAYYPVPEYSNMKANQLKMTTYKVCCHIHSRSTYCKTLSELYHDNPAWINSKTASGLGIKDGDMIKVKSTLGEIKIAARVSEMVAPGVISISYHVGRKECGRYASGTKSPFGHDNDPDLKRMWWKKHGVHPNYIIANSSDPISGQQRFMDTVVTVSKA